MSSEAKAMPMFCLPFRFPYCVDFGLINLYYHLFQSFQTFEVENKMRGKKADAAFSVYCIADKYGRTYLQLETGIILKYHNCGELLLL